MPPTWSPTCNRHSTESERPPHRVAPHHHRTRHGPSMNHPHHPHATEPADRRAEQAHGRDEPAIVIAANRLPVMRTDDGWAPSPGGLVRALLPMLRQTGGLGSAGRATPTMLPSRSRSRGSICTPCASAATRSSGTTRASPTTVSGRCTTTPFVSRRSTATSGTPTWWSTNVLLSQLAEVAPHGATVWVQDYQLQLVPAMLRRERPDLTIGFFLHIPFPPFELFSRLPWRGDHPGPAGM